MKTAFAPKFLQFLLLPLFVFMLNVGWGQTNNYFGTSGTITGSVWSTNPAGPYTSALVATNGPILNFNNPGSATGATIATCVGINFGAAITWTAGGTIGAAGINLPINVSSGISQNLTSGLSTAATAAFTKNGAGALLTAGGTFGGGFTLNAGTLIAGGVNAMGGNASPGLLTLNGGTIAGSGNRDFTGKYSSIVIGGNIQFGELSTVWANANSAANLIFSNATSLGAATRTITIGGTGTYTLGGVISGAAGSGLTINTNSTGNITLTGVNTYTGNTTINGNLILSGSGSIATSPIITIGSGGTFGVTGLTTALALGSTQTLKASATGSNTTGTITVASGKGLTLGSTNGLEFTAYDGGATAPLTISGASAGALALNSAPIKVSTSTALAAGTYKLIAKASSATGVSGTIGTLTLAGSGIAANTTATLSIVSGELILTVTAATPTITSSGTLSAVNTTYGTASASPTSFNVSGANMTAGILVTPPTGYEVCLTSNGTYTSTVTVGTSGTISSTPVYVRLAAATAVGSYSGNIVLSSTSATSVNVATVSSAVSAKALTITGLSAENKNYDGTTTVSVTGTAAYSGLVNSESFPTVSTSGTVSWVFPSSSVGNYTLTQTNTYTAPSSNYSITQPSLTASINAIVPTAPTITGITAGSAQLSVAFTAPSSNGGASITNYEYSTNGGSSFTAFSPAQTTTPLVISGLLNGTTYDVLIRAVNSAGNGTVSNMIQGTPVAPASPTITVTPALFTSSFSTTYGTPSAVQTFSVSAAAIDQDVLVTAPTGFEISLTNNTGFASSLTLAQSAGEVASTTIYARLLATATAGSNYNSSVFTISVEGATDGTITTSSSGNAVAQKALTITGLSVANKSYDGNTNAAVSGTAAYTGLANGETFAVVGSATATFASANVGNGIEVTVNGFSAPSTNYSISQPSFTANISAVNLTISGIAISNKTYNGTNAATIAGTAAYQGLVNSESYTVSGTPTAVFTSVTVGTSIAVTVSGYTAPSANYTLTQPTGLTADITQANQTITFTALASKTTADVPFALTATASSGLSISYTSSNTAVATISGSTVTIVGAGTTSITASQAGNENYNAATSVSQNLVVTNAPVVLAGWDFNAIVSGTTYNTYTATTFSTDLVSASSANTITRGSGASWSTGGNSFRTTGFQNNGISTANTDYFQVTLQPVSGKLVSLNSINAKFAGTSTFYASPGVTSQFAYSLDGTNFTLIGQPFVTLSSSLTSTPSIDLTGVSALQNIPTGTTITLRYYASGQTATGGWGFASAAAGTNGLAIGGIISNPISAPTLTADATSNTVDNNIDITFTDDATWTSAITAVKIGATTLTPTTDYVISAGNIQLLPSGGNALLTTAGTKAITIVAPGYTNATVSQVINAGVPTSNSTATINSILASGATSTITCTAKDQYSNLVSGYTFKYDATVVADNASTTESYAIDGSAITSSVNNVSINATTEANGVATFTVVMPSALDEADGLSIQVQLANGSTNVGTPFAYHELPSQTITFNALDAKIYGDVSFNLFATGGASGNPVVFTSSNNAVATCTGTNGTTVTIIGAGTATIHANQAASSSYNAAAAVSQTLTVNQKGLTITGVGAADKVYNGSSAAVITGTPAYVGLVNSESFSVTGTGVAAFSDAEAGIGKTVNFSGYTAPSANYSITQPTATATISQATQTIVFASLPNRFVGGPTYTLTQNATSGLAITYTSSNTGVATINGNTVTVVGAGNTTITASQAGNNNYTAATSVAQIQTIIALPIAAWDFFGQISPATFAATTFNSNLDATSALSEITRGSGASSNGVLNAFSTTGFQNNGISTTNTDYFQVTLKANAGYILTLSEINANFDGTSTFYATSGVTSQYAYSLNGIDFTLIGSPITSTSLKPAAVDLTGVSALQNLSANTTVTIRYYASGQTTTGGWRFSSPASGVPGLAIGGSLCLVPTTPLISSTTFCVVGETGSISTTTSELNVNYELYDSNGVVPNSTKSGTGNALTWSNITDENYYVVATNPLGDCSSTSATLNVTGTIAAYSYYLDSDADGYGTGTALHGCLSTAPAGYSLNTGDCNNSNSAYYPTAVEICGNGIDENCSGPSDDAPISYRSVTSGNWGDASTWEMACYAGSAYTAATYAPVSSFTGIASIQSTHEVVIPNNGTIYQTGTLDIDAGGTLTMTGNDYNNDPTTANVSAVAKLTVTLVIINDGTMNVGHQASLVQTATTAGTVNSGSGNFNVQSKLTGNWSSPTGAPNGRYWYIGSPMNNTVASQFFDTPSMVRLWRYNGTNNSWGIVIHSQTSTNSSLKLVPGIGYLYRAGANKTITYTSTAANLNNNITSNLLAPASDAAYIPVLGYSTIGYKYVANPYPSYVDWTLLSRTGLNAGYWIRNATNTAYDAYNATTQLGSSPSGQTTKFIPPMQGFWVYAYTTPNALKIDNTDRVHSTNVLHAPVTNQVVRLKLNNGESSDYTVVYENEVAANDFEEADTDKMFDYDFHQLYTLEGEHELVLNGLSNATSKGSVDMGISVANIGQYTIEATDLEMEEGVILEDRFNHTFQDMKVNPIYSFTTNAGTFNERFVLHFTATESVAVGETETVGLEETETVGETEGVNVYTTIGQRVKVWISNTSEYQGATVKVFDAIGNLVERKNMTSNELYLDLDIANGIYVVEVTGDSKVFTKKIFISK